MWAQRIWPVNHDWKGLSKGLLLGGIVFIIGWNIKINQPWLSLFTKVIVGIALFGLLIWFASDILTRAEQHKFLTYLIDGRKRLATALFHKS
ncbi:MAG: hypothetical protein COX41_03605 [Candidatus Omnitrophica bacterium CG23_combo_of_CG06-09_8_20_14_all_41_10]|uniref:Uncharacterized protein n=1 Tax=Candidatus Sherwoodlollariibacterium unditelluris TaxID=1974757 RepID=A0A2G9YJG5_9BACT|nr:MAG: hypothetical protein COX41_03605 [Candidatus Omnitrophica bacterium CG23_combo_of_CG06-09_8_20_14_all_41_10]